MEIRGLTLEQLARQKFRLSNAIWMKIDELRKSEAAKGYNTLLFGPGSGKIEVSPQVPFRIHCGQVFAEFVLRRRVRIQQTLLP